MPTTPASIEVERLLTRRVSFLVSVKSRRPPQTIALIDYLDRVRSGRWRCEVEGVREANARSKEEADAVKVACLPVIKPSGIFRGLREADFVEHSGILCIDLDDIGLALADTKKRLQGLPCVVALHASPRATGLKVFLAVTATDAEQHRACWTAAKSTLSSVLPAGVRLDPAPSNVSSNCFVSYDPDTWVAVALRVPLFPSPCDEPSSIRQGFRHPSSTCKEGPRRRRREGVISEESMSDAGSASSSMSDLRGETLSAETSSHFDEIQRRGRDAKNRQRARHALKAMLPVRKRIFRQFIESKPVNRGGRHAFLTQVIPPLFEVIAESVLLDLLRLHHRAQTGTWRTGLGDHMQEAEKMLSAYGARYRGMLGERERSVFYDRLSDERRMAAFRICRGLAACGKARVSGAFFLSCAELAARINCHPDTAHAILCEFKAERLIECVCLGDAFTVELRPGEKRRATSWRWIEASSSPS